MSGAFCSHCGKPIYPGGQFCGFCATPVAATSAPAASPAGEPPGGLSNELGLAGTRVWQLWRRSQSDGGLYDVLSESQQLLCRLQGIPSHPRFSIHFGTRSGGGLPAGASGDARTHAWVLTDPQGRPRATAMVQHAGAAGAARLVDAAEALLLSAQSVAHGWSGYELTVAGADGQPLLSSSGKIHANDLEVVDVGGSPVAALHRKSLTLGDHVSVEMLGVTVPVAVLLIALLLDRERETRPPPGAGERAGGAHVRL